MVAPALDFRMVTHDYPIKKHQTHRVVQDITFQVQSNDFVTLLGPSGCGKTTLLRMAAGLLAPTHGLVSCYGEPITRPNERSGYVPQSLSLFPWLTVQENVRFGLEFRRLSKEIIQRRVDDMLEEVDLTNFASYYPNTLSGGMQQRVSLARMIVLQPEVFLMDEPFGSLDSQTRREMQDHLLSTWSAHKRSVLFVTHDVEEAVYLSDKIVIMANAPGRILSVHDIFIERPRTQRVKRSQAFLALIERISMELE